MNPLREYSAAWIQVFGFEYLGSATSELQTDVYWSTPLTGNFLEVLSQKNRVLNQRIVGDGTSLWSYNPLRNEYSASLYGAFSGPQPQTYRSNLLSSLNHMLKGEAAYAGRLLNEVYGGLGVVYRPWVPSGTEPAVYENGAFYENPMTRARYTSIPTQLDYVVYELGSPLRRVVVFERMWVTLPGGYDGWKLTKVYLSESARLGTKNRLVDISIAFNGGSIPSTASYTFQPPAGAKSIAGPRPSGG